TRADPGGKVGPRAWAVAGPPRRSGGGRPARRPRRYVWRPGRCRRADTPGRCPAPPARDRSSESPRSRPAPLPGLATRLFPLTGVLALADAQGLLHRLLGAAHRATDLAPGAALL